MWKYVFPDYFVCYYPSLATATQIVVPPQNQTVPVNSVARFTCRTTSFVVWQVNNAQLLSMFIETFRLRGITLDGENGSVLLVNATLRNNGAKIFCITGSELHVTSKIAIMTVFGELNMN